MKQKSVKIEKITSNNDFVDAWRNGTPLSSITASLNASKFNGRNDWADWMTSNYARKKLGLQPRRVRGGSAQNATFPEKEEQRSQLSSVEMIQEVLGSNLSDTTKRALLKFMV